MMPPLLQVPKRIRVEQKIYMFLEIIYRKLEKRFNFHACGVRYYSRWRVVSMQFQSAIF